MLDILLETSYQLFDLYRADSIISSFLEFVTSIFNEHLTTAIFSSIKHKIMSLSSRCLLICTCVAVLIILGLSKAKTSILEILNRASSSITAFYELKDVKCLSKLQLFAVLYLEARWLRNFFVTDNSMYLLCWNVFVYSIALPLEIKFKMFLENKMRAKQPLLLHLYTLYLQ